MNSVFVTGATSGIGEELLKQYHASGRTVIFCGRRKEKILEIENTLNLIRPKSAKGFVADVVHREDLKVIADWISGNNVHLEIVVANAGFGVSGRIEDLALSDFQKQFDTNVWGVLHTIQLFLPFLKKSHGKLAIVGSGSSYISTPDTGAYCMSKFAVRALADALRSEVHNDHVSVTLICPGFVESEIRHKTNTEELRPQSKDPIPSFLVMKAPKAARQIIRAIDRRQAEAWITTHVKVFILLEKFFPGLIRLIKNKVRKAK